MESLYLLAFLIGFALLLVVISHLKFRKEKPEPANTCPHFFRSIAAPYARQCRKCGLVVFREDEHGNFPDGLMEYFEYAKTYRGTPSFSGNGTYHRYDKHRCCTLPKDDPIHDEQTLAYLKGK